MKLLTKLITEQLLRNGGISRKYAEEGVVQPDFQPIMKLFTPDANSTGLLSELDPDEPAIAFGLCDLGMGFPELGAAFVCADLRLKLDDRTDHAAYIGSWLKVLKDDSKAIFAADYQHSPQPQADQDAAV